MTVEKKTAEGVGLYHSANLIGLVKRKECPLRILSLSTQILSFPARVQSPKQDVRAGLRHRMCLEWPFPEAPAWPLASLSSSLYGSWQLPSCKAM